MNATKPKTLILVTLISLWCASCAHLKTGLYHDEINIKAKEGKESVMTFDELERHERYSIIKVKRTSGAPAASMMFVVKGCYKIAKIRKTDYFIILKEWIDDERNWAFKVGFSSDKNIDPRAYFGDDIDLTKDLMFVSVKDYDTLWKSKN